MKYRKALRICWISSILLQDRTRLLAILAQKPAALSCIISLWLEESSWAQLAGFDLVLWAHQQPIFHSSISAASSFHSTLHSRRLARICFASSWSLSAPSSQLRCSNNSLRSNKYMRCFNIIDIYRWLSLFSHMRGHVDSKNLPDYDHVCVNQQRFGCCKQKCWITLLEKAEKRGVASSLIPKPFCFTSHVRAPMVM